MRFFRQTLLSVCLILPWGVFAQPVANDDVASTDEDTNVVFDITSNDTDATFGIDPATVDLDLSSPLTIESTFIAPEGQFSVSIEGILTFTPALHFFGLASLSYSVRNTNPTPETSGPGLITITVTAVNDAPTITTLSDQVIEVDNTTGALAFTIGDVETDVTLLILSGSSSNTTLVPNGNITFGGSGASRTVTVTPAPGESGVTTITVNVSDGDITTPETFLLTVNAANSLPTITSIANQVVNEDTPTGALGFTIADVETAAISLVVTALSSNPTLVPNGNIIIGGSGASRTVLVTPLANQFGIANITLTVDDGTDTNETTFAVTVNAINDLPTITSIADQTINVDTQTGMLAFTVGDIETAAGSLTVTGVSSNPALVPNVNIGLGGSGADRTVQVTPLAAQTGVAIITLTVNDGTADNQTTFEITVNAIVNNAPTITSIGDQTINEDNPTSALAFTIGDAETAVESLTLSGGSTNITLVPNGNITFGGSGASRTVTVTPALNQVGSATITVNVSDGVNTTPETFLLTVNAVNDAPTITAISNQVVNEDNPTGAIAFTIGDAETPVESLTLSGSSTNTTLVPTVNIAIAGTGASRTVIVTPALNQFGTATITVNVSDGVITTQETFLLTVNAVNDAPTIAAISNQVVNEDVATGALAVTVGDIDNAAGSLSITGTSNNTSLIPNSNIVLGGSGANRTVTISPLSNQNGVATIMLLVSDGVSSTPTAFQVTVTAVNDDPTITSLGDQTIPENTPTGPREFTVGDIETPAASLLLTPISSNTSLVTNANVVLAGIGSLRNVNVIPSINQIGMTTITLTVSDDGGKTSQTAFQVLVTAVDAPPTITPISDQVINEDAATGVLAFTIDDPDTGSGSLTVTAESGNDLLIPDGNISLGGSGANRTVQVTPLANQNGTAIITITVSDGVETAFITFEVAVTAINDVPTISAISDVVVNENVSTGAIAFTIGDVETAPGSLNVSGTSSNTTLVPNGNIVFGGSDAFRNVTVTPAAGQSGSATITVNVTDGTATTPETFLLTVTAVNDPPTITPIGDQVVNEDTPTGAIAFTIDDPETPAGSLNVTGSSSNTTLVPNANVVFGGSNGSRTVTVTPAANLFGVTTITVNVSDGVNTTPETFLVTVNTINDPPTISSIPTQNILEDAPTGTGILAFTVGDVETAPGVLTVTRTSSNLVLMPLDNVVLGGSGANRTVIATPAPNQFGSTTITLTVNDGTTTVNTNFVVNVASVNDEPTITPITDQIINENTSTGALGFTIGDVETAVGALSVTRTSSNTTLVPLANVVLGGSGANRTVTVTPAPNQSGATNITITVGDGTTTTDMTFQVTVNAVNDPPTITPIADQVVNEDVATSALAFTIADAETAAGSLILTGTSSNTTLVPNLNIVFGGSLGSRTVTVTPAPNLSGTTTITVNVSDGVTVVPETFQLTVNPVNDPPTITAIANQNINEDAPGGTGILAFTIGDVETAAGVLTVTRTSSNLVLMPLANVVLGGSDANRTVIATPAPNQFGSTTITLTVSDGTTTVNTNFVVNVASVNDEPTITLITDQIINENTSTGALGFTIGDVETAVGALSVTRTSSNTTLVPLANVVLGGSGANRTVTVTPAPNQFGVTNITITVGDGTTTTDMTFQVTVNAVNDPPTITPISDQVVNEDVATSALAFTIADAETAAGSLILTGTSSNTTLVPNLNIVFGGSGGSRTVTVTPAPNLSGTTTITVNVSDGVTVVPESFQLTVNAVNDPPTITAIANQNINEDAPGGTGILAFTIGDVETPAGSLTVTRTSSNLVLVPLANVVLGGSDANRTVIVTPAPNQFGSTTITLTVSDGTTTVNTNFLVTVASVNDNPTITVIADQIINENTSTSALGFTIGDVETPVGSLTVTRSSSNSTLVPLANIVLGGSGANRTVTVTPAPNEFGAATITVTVGDGTSTAQTAFELTVNAINDPPTISAIGDQVINEDFSTGALAFTISDPETAPGSLILTAISSNTALVPNVNISFGGSGGARTVTVTPAANQSGVTSITISVSDGVTVVPEIFQVTVNAVNDAPTVTAIANQTIVEDTQTGNLAFTVGDEETPAASLVVTASSSNTTLVPNANVTLGGSGPSRTVNVIPVTNSSGVTTITINVSDGTLVTPMVFQVTVNAVNDPPTITAIANQTVTEDTPTGVLPFTIGDLDTPVGSLVITPSSSNTTLVPTANIVIAGSGASRTVQVTPAANQTGITTITLTVSDGTVTTETDFTVTVTPVNDPPTISTITNRTINEDSQTGTINFTIGDAETAASALIVTGTSSNTTLVPNANIVLGGSGTSRTVQVIPAANQSGVTTITLSVNDGTVSVPTNFTVTVNAINDAPLITNQVPISINEVQPIVLSLAQLTVVDPDNNYPADFSLFVLGGANYSVVGTTVTPVANFSGTLVVPVFVNDGALSSPFYNLQISVNSTNDPPVITNQQPLSMNEDQTIAISLANLVITDPDNNPADFTLTVLPPAVVGAYTFTGNTVTPALNFNGTLTVRVKVNDGSIDSAPYNLQITVNPVNDPPVITAQSPLSTNEDTPILLVVGNFTITDPEPTTHTLTVAPAPGINYTVSGNTVTPNANFSGTLSVPVTVSDGVLTSASFNAQIQVVPVNDPPVITGQVSLSTVEDIPLTIKLADLTVTDVDNTYPTGFTLAILAGTNYTFSGATITPVLDFVGTITVNVRVNDGTSNSNTFPLQVQVTDDADAPVITGQNPVSMNEDGSRAITLADLIWEDPDTPAPQITVTVLPGTNYNITGNSITPIANFFGTLSVNVRINDGVANSNTFPLQVTVVGVNDLPSFNSIANVVLLEDAPLQTLTITGISPGPLETQPLQLTVISDNTALIPQPAQTPAYNGTATSAVITFKPEPNAFGTATITVRVTDTDLAEFVRTFTITVTPVNDAPTLAPITVAAISEDAPEQLIPLTGISVGGGLAESGQVLTFIPSTDKPELFEVFEVVYVSPQATGTLRVKPKPNANGTAQITLRLQDDGSGTAPNVNFVIRSFALVISPVNDLPVFISEPVTLAEPGQVYSYAIEVIDVDGQVITLTAPVKPAWLTFTPGTNGKATLSGTPPANATGDINIVIEAKDPSLVVVSQGYTLTINSRPVLSPVTVSVNEDQKYDFKASDFAAGFADSDGNTLSELQITKLPTRGILRYGTENVTVGLKIDADDISSLNYTPLTDSTGRDTLRWNASDGFLLYSVADTYAVLNVSTTNDAPIISFLEPDSLKYELGSEVPVFLTPAFDAYDPDGDNITRAEIRIENLRFRAENEELIFPGSPKIAGIYDDAAGVLTLLGSATAKEYVDAIRSIKYNYSDAKELILDSRNVYITLNDGQLESVQKARIVTLVYTFSDLDIPTAFTPNGDQANETWVVTSPNGTEQYSDAEIKIYDKRGVLLFESKGFEQPWNGVWNGEVLPPNTYFYTIELNYNKVLYKGTVTILR